VSREDLMMVLQNIDYMLIKAGYDENQDEVRSAFHTLLFACSINYGFHWSMSRRRSIVIGSAKCLL